VQKITRLFIAALFGSIIFVTRLFVPPPIDKMLIAVDAVLLALSALFIKKVGATYAGAVGGALTGLWRPSLLPFSLIYAFLYGVMVDAFLFLFFADGVYNLLCVYSFSPIDSVESSNGYGSGFYGSCYWSSGGLRSFLSLEHFLEEHNRLSN